jgi:hypothetical protein
MEKASEMSALCEASSIMRELALPERGKRALIKVSMKLPDWTFRHVKAVFYQEPGTRVCHDQMKQLRRAAKLDAQEQEASNEISQLRAEIAFIKDRLRRMDQDFYEPTASALGVVSREYERKTNEPQ